MLSSQIETDEGFISLEALYRRVKSHEADLEANPLPHVLVRQDMQTKYVPVKGMNYTLDEHLVWAGKSVAAQPRLQADQKLPVFMNDREQILTAAHCKDLPSAAFVTAAGLRAGDVAMPSFMFMKAGWAFDMIVERSYALSIEGEGLMQVLVRFAESESAIWICV